MLNNVHSFVKEPQHERGIVFCILDSLAIEFFNFVPKKKKKGALCQLHSQALPSWPSEVFETPSFMDHGPECNLNPPIVKGLVLNIHPFEASQANRIDPFLDGQDTARNHAPYSEMLKWCVVYEYCLRSLYILAPFSFINSIHNKRLVYGRMVMHLAPYAVKGSLFRLGIRGTRVKSSIQDIVDEVAPIKKPPYGVEG